VNIGLIKPEIKFSNEGIFVKLDIEIIKRILIKFNNYCFKVKIFENFYTFKKHCCI